MAVLEDDLESAENALFDLAWDEVILALRRGAIEAHRCDNSRRFEVGEAELRALALSIALATMRFCVVHWRDGIETLAMIAMRDAKIAEQRRENGQILYAEGQAARSKKRAENDRILCKLYRSVRGSFGSGGKENTAALDVVRERHRRQTKRDRPVDRKTVRNALKRCGVPCR